MATSSAPFASPTERRRLVVAGHGCLKPNGPDVRSTWDEVLRTESGAAPITRFDTRDLPVGIACEVKDRPPLADVSARDACRLDHVVGKARPARVRRVPSNSFGFRGTNGCLVLAGPNAGTA